MLTKKTTIILDTNALLLFGTEHVDVFSEIERVVTEPHEIVIPESVLQELEKLGKKNTKDARAAKLAYSLVHERLKRQREPLIAKLLFPQKEIALKTVRGSQTHADDAILAIAEDDPARTVAVTLDKGLQGRLLAKKVRIVGMKQRRLAFV